MAIFLPDQTWRDIESLIREALSARETYRTQAQNARTSAAAWKPVMKLLSKFPENTFNHTEVTDINPYGREVLVAFTEGIWAFSLGPILHDLDCPQTATDLYSYFAQDLYQVWYNTDGRGRTYATLFSEVTNSVADYNLITMDAVARQGLVNSPRAAMAAHAWIITNAMHGNNDWEMIQRARELWEARCGPFVVATN
ncbi:uncharacterized protein FIESC28_10273 [Fusarium coffeatum]|uniref:Uncharacterized protein n=1 Tax=Fusarium coffeatum TaxID=231269 RepID=A0A366QVW7_9HYPO|nr:uncharacterized protein FIESC28_10273 [Fusarium coffeatum]RBR08368.1 hypothetical protein FIESC28_10273 [Fusarium coffeatum]